MPVSEQRKAIARYLASQFGGRPPITSYLTSDKTLEVGVMTAVDIPAPGQISYATLGLSEHPLIFKGGEFQTRAELVGFSVPSGDRFPKALSTACFSIIRSTHFAAPGVIARDVFTESEAGRVRHFLFSNPFPWHPPLISQIVDSVRVAWLLAVPVTDAEADFAESRGGRALEDAFDAQQIDIADLERQEARLSNRKRQESAPAKTKRAEPQPVTDGWSIRLPAGFRRRVEDGSVVFWRKGLTIWSFSAPSQDAADVRIERFLAEATGNRADERPFRGPTLSGVSYRAFADGGDAKVASLNAVVAAPGASLILSFYFDDEKDAESCLRILDSVAHLSPHAN